MRQLAMRERHADVIQHVAGKKQQREVAQRQDARRYRMLVAKPVLVLHLPEQLRQRLAALKGVVQAAQRCRRDPLGASVGTDLPSRHDVVRLREIAQKAGAGHLFPACRRAFRAAARTRPPRPCGGWRRACRGDPRQTSRRPDRRRAPASGCGTPFCGPRRRL